MDPTIISPFGWKVPAAGGGYNIIMMDYTNWASGQPDNGGNTTAVTEACLAMQSGGSNQWDDASCDLLTCAICEHHQDVDDDHDHEH